MKRLILPIVAAATLLGTAAASAQSVEFNVGPRHPGFQVRDDAYFGDRDWRRAHNEWRGRDTIVIRRHHRDWDRDRYYEERGPGFSFRTY